jgi:PAS domain S-box-containing protein
MIHSGTPLLTYKQKNFIILVAASAIFLCIYTFFYDHLLQVGLFDDAPYTLPLAVDITICFIFIITALLFHALKGKQKWDFIPKVFAFACAVCALIPFEYETPVFSHNVFTYMDPGMSPQTALCFLLLSISVFYLKTKRIRLPIQILLHLVSFIAIVVIIGYTVDIPQFYTFSSIQMGLPSAIVFLILSGASSLANPSIGITGIFTGKMIGNVMARRVAVKMIVATLILGPLWVFVHTNNWISTEFCMGLIVICIMLINILIVYTTSHRLNKIDLKRKIAMDNFSMAFETAPYSLMVSDNKGIIVNVNSQTEKIFGYRRDELMGQSLETIIPKKLRNDYFKQRESFFAAPEVKMFGMDGELLAMKKDGCEFPIELLMAPVKTSTTPFLMSTVIDITHRKEQEKTIRMQLAELRSKNGELEQFNYISSHDLQEPLRTVLNYIELLEEDYPEQINSGIKKHLDAMHESISRMGRIVGALLDFGKLGRNKKLVIIDTNITISNVIADLNGLISKSGAKIPLLNDFPVLSAYEVELRQLFQNLINNAIKFQKKDSAPVVEISGTYNGKFYEFCVSDNGIGIQPQHLQKIFNIFERLGDKEEYAGYGIGLANCKKIAEMHGGKIWAESDPGKGSTFKFTILSLKNI